MVDIAALNDSVKSEDEGPRSGKNEPFQAEDTETVDDGRRQNFDVLLHGA